MRTRFFIFLSITIRNKARRSQTKDQPNGIAPVVFTDGIAARDPFGRKRDRRRSAPFPNTPQRKASWPASRPVTRPTTDFTTPEPFEQNAAGAATISATTAAKAFKSPSANMAFERKMNFLLGEALFEKLWVSSPSSTKASDGVGPLYNARSCARCHPNAGRGHPPQNSDEPTTSMFMRLSVPGGVNVPAIKGYIATQAEPVYGLQFQDVSVGGLLPEGQLKVRYQEVEIALAGGEVARLRTPSYQLEKTGLWADAG